MSNRSELEDKEVDYLKKLIRETPMRVNIVKQTMKRVESNGLKDTSVDTVVRTMKLVESNNLSDNTHRRNVLRRIMITMATAVAVVTLVMGTKFISPTTTASIQQGSVMGTIFKYSSDYGLKNADEKGLVTTLNRSVTHEGFTLKVPVVVYDGIRVAIGIERQTSEQKYLKEDVGGNISDVKVSINGKPLQSLDPYGKSSDFFINNGMYIYDNNTSYLQISDMRNQGGKAFPDKFQLTLTMTVSGILEPFQFNIPVENMTKDIVDITPSITRQYETISVTLKKVEMTLMTTNITTLVKFPESMSKHELQPDLGFAIYDDKGNELRAVRSNVWFRSGVGNVDLMDFGYEPFVTMPKSITMKTFKKIRSKVDKSKFMHDANGAEIRVYFPALEITIPINQVKK
ncbi:DUF4179 domain-containing protein [Paenibacillus glacialis]|uniref:DUF4179 domain-containing protein n=1 Tax=Paenibacillus glacialis TaxID=494026 RepID=A0A168H7P4_9BACL|nr:DUF4179 domain-containing protein [Paenibacillus glacialis]OAB37908.1 hypothetical protein PGLA_20515 [Paenibacillus glacialis]